MHTLYYLILGIDNLTFDWRKSDATFPSAGNLLNNLVHVSKHEVLARIIRSWGSENFCIGGVFNPSSVAYPR
jgi:hypothetical protein